MKSDGRYRVAFPERWWYPACRSADLTARPLGITLMDTPLVLFRDRAGVAHALLDRCPHRNLALSLGRVRADGCLECAYHGWRFDGTGQCTAVPGLADGAGASRVRNASGRDTCEQDGFVWVWGEAGGTAGGRQPFRPPTFAGRGSGQVVFERDLECTMHAAIENSLDVPHTAYLHRGLFRGAEPSSVTAVRRDLPGGVEVQYLGEPVAFGRLRPRQADLTFDHWDRFLLPSIAQVEYRVKGWLQLVNTILHLPMSPFRTRAWFVVRFWTRVPPSLARPVISVRGRQILGQDALVLAQQADNIRRFGRERYTSTDLDLIGNAVWRLLRDAERADRADSVGGAGDTAGADDPDPDGTEPTNSSVTFQI